MKPLIIGCVDPRVDPADIFGLKAGEAAVIRNVEAFAREALAIALSRGKPLSIRHIKLLRCG